VKITEDWRKLHNEKLHDFYFSNIMVTKSKRKRWGGGGRGKGGGKKKEGGGGGGGMWKEGGEQKCIHRCGWKT